MPSNSKKSTDEAANPLLSSDHDDLDQNPDLKKASERVPPPLPPEPVDELDDMPPSEHKKEPAFQATSLGSDSKLAAEISRIKKLFIHDFSRSPYHGDLTAKRHALVDDIIKGVNATTETPDRKIELLKTAYKCLPKTFLEGPNKLFNMGALTESTSQKLLKAAMETIRNTPDPDASPVKKL